jgi:uracil-DNA glycosylase
VLKNPELGLLEKKPAITFLLLGRLANNIDQLIMNPHVNKIYAEHPYNISFITEPKILKFFKPLHLLQEKNFSLRRI